MKTENRGSFIRPAYDPAVALELLRCRGAWPARGPKARGWGEHLRRLGIKPRTALEWIERARAEQSGVQHQRQRRRDAARKRPTASAVTSSFVYFAQAGSGAIKIGVSADVRSRIRELQVGSAPVIRLIGVAPGNRDLESKIHRSLTAARVRGEWFRDCPEVRAVIAEVCR